MAVRLELTDEDAKTLLDALDAHLKGFRREVAGTENPTFRRALQQQQNTLERVVETLRGQGA